MLLNIISMEFPYKYKQFAYPNAVIQQLWSNLVNYDFEMQLTELPTAPKIHNLPQVDPAYYDKIGKYPDGNKVLALISTHSDYEQFNILSDFFQEPARMQARVRGSEYSPLEYWNIKQNELIAQHGTDMHKLREALYKQVPEAGTFRPGIVKLFVQVFKARRVLDLCAGWGDRLIGAAAANVELYHGVDPNPLVHPGYKRIQETLGFDPARFLVVNDDGLTVGLKMKYDLAITCPPYYDYETYSTNARQSIMQFKTESEWYMYFLLPLMQKMWNALENGGHLVLILNHTKVEQNYLRWLTIDTQEWNFCGLMLFADQNLSNPQPIWVWEKS